MQNDLSDAQWIARAVPASQRITRSIRRDRIDRVQPGHSLAQTFTVEGSVTAISVDIAAPDGEGDPFLLDVRFTLRMETTDGTVLAELLVEGPQLLWDRFDRLLELPDPAPAGTYRVVLVPQRHSVGWWTAEASAPGDDDGISPRPVLGEASRDGVVVAGVRTLGVETAPAPNPLFRRAFHLDVAAEDAILTTSVLGSGVVWINGVRVGEEMIEPAVTDYDETVLYRSWLVGHLLRVGGNELLIAAGRERYAARGGDIWGWYLAPWHREPVALARLHVLRTDGEELDVVTDASWQTAAGDVERELLFGGEDWVVRSGSPQWESARVVDPPLGRLREATHPAVLASAPIPPVIVDRLSSTAKVYDFGSVMTGRIRCVVTGRAGDSVTVTSGEARGHDGGVVCENVLAVGAAQRDTLRLECDVVDHVWEPQFGYRGFRWAEVEVTGSAVVRQVRAVPLSTPLDVVGRFESDDELAVWIDSALARTFRNNLHGIPTDTPIYEKNGWTADAHLATEGLLHHFNLRTAFGKWMDDHVDSQASDGAVPQIVPTPGWGRASDPAWSSSAVLIPWYLYREYGDLGTLSRYSDMIRRYADQLLGRLDGGVWVDRTWGDWLAPGYGVGPEGMTSIGTITTVNALQHTALVLREIGAPDAAAYEHAAANVGATYHSTFFDAAEGCYRVPGAGYRQSLNVLPLAFGVVPDDEIVRVRGSLVHDIEDRTHGHLDCGAIAVKHLLPVLSDAGRDDLALTVLLQRGRPGWGSWFEGGETTLLEAWGEDARSRNHYFLGSVASWIQQRIGGLRLDAPGWRRMVISPIKDERIHAARISHRTPLGEAGVDWKRGPGGWELSVTVPDGAIATVIVPGFAQEVRPGVSRLRIPDMDS